MLNILVLLAAVWNFYIGYTRGIILQVYYFFSLLVSLFVASQYYQPLAERLTLWIPYSNPAEGAEVLFFKSVNIFELDKVFYNGIGFILVFLVTYVIMRLLGILVHFAPLSRFDEVKVNLLSGLLASFTPLVFASLGFSVLATIPLALIQNHLATSSVARFLIDQFPFLSDLVRKLWIG